MAINFTDFSRAPILDAPGKTIFEDLLKGYQVAKEPEKMQQESSARDLANKLRALEVEHKPKQFELDDQGKGLANALKSKALEHYDEKNALDMEYKKAQIQKALQTKLGGNVKANGELANYMVSHPNATEEEVRKAYEEIHGSKLEHEKAVTERSKDITAGASFDKSPMNDKKRNVGLMTAMGVDPIQAVSLLRGGTTPTQWAEDNGIDINTVVPSYAPGEQNVKQWQQASAYLDEMDSLEAHITDGLGQYQNKIMGYSLQEIADSMKGDKPDKVGKALAARALLPELSALRLKVQGGNVGIEAIRELEDKSLGKLRVLESTVDKKAYQAMQKYMNQWLHDAADKRIKSLKSFGMLKTKLQKSAEKESTSSGFDFSSYPVAGGR